MVWENLPSTNTPLNATNLNQFDQYSTTETVIGKWINNKPIYRKVINVGNLPNNNYINIAHNISNLGVLVDLRLTVDTGSSQYITNMKGTSSAYNSGTTLARVTSTNIQIVTDTDYSSHTAIAIIEYTKTTD